MKTIGSTSGINSQPAGQPAKQRVWPGGKSSPAQTDGLFSKRVVPVHDKLSEEAKRELEDAFNKAIEEDDKITSIIRKAIQNIGSRSK